MNKCRLNKWQNDCGAVSMPKDSICTRIVTFETAKHFNFDRNTVCLKVYLFCS